MESIAFSLLLKFILYNYIVNETVCCLYNLDSDALVELAEVELKNKSLVLNMLVVF